MGVLRWENTSPATSSEAFRHQSNQISLGALVSIIIAGTIILGAGAVFLGLWLSQRRAERKEQRLHGETMSIDSTWDMRVMEPLEERKLKKGAGASTDKLTGDSPRPSPKRKSILLFPRNFSGPKFGRSLPLNWSSKLHIGGKSKKIPSWIDADKLHGPEIGPQENPNRRSRFRDSWPLGNRAPTLPETYQSPQHHPYEESLSEDVLFGIDHIRSAYGQLRMYSRILPMPPQPALVSNQDRRHSHVRPMSAPVNALRHPAEDAKGQQIGPVVGFLPQAGSLPNTPLKNRLRQASTESTLSEILRLTEERLQDGAPSTRKLQKLTKSPSKIRTSRESLLDHSKSPGQVELPPSPTRSSIQPRTPSPKKSMAGRSTPGHKRQDSEASVASEADSLLEELLLQDPKCSSELIRPSRNLKKQEPEVIPAQSTRTSISSALSTVYSEDERSEGTRTAVNTPGGISPETITIDNIKSIMVSPESMADPFSPTARPSTCHGWPGKPTKGQDLFRESLKRSQHLRRMTLGQTLTLPSEVKLPPCSVPSGHRSQALTGFHPVDHTSFHRPSLIGSRSRSPLPSRSSKLPIPANDAQFVTRANEAQASPSRKFINAIQLPPPPTTRHSTSPTTSPSPLVSRLAHRASTASSISIYSQHSDPNPDPISIIPTLITSPSHPSPSPSAGLLAPPGTYTSLTGVTATVAELRRMNSCISTISSPTPEPILSSNAHIHPLLRDRNTIILSSGIGSVAKRSRASGNRHYLSLGVTPPHNLPSRPSCRQSPGTVSLGGSPRHRIGAPRLVSRKMSVSPVSFGDGGEGKEEKEEKEKEKKIGEDGQQGEEGLKKEGEERGNVGETPAKKRRYESGRRGSQESLGLYDQEGFLIGTPLRYGRDSPIC